MVRQVKIDDLVGVSEIADRLGVPIQTVHSWRRRRFRDFPEPIAQLRQALIWAWPDVERWAKKTGRL